jgi:hypothetical protein
MAARVTLADLARAEAGDDEARILVMHDLA